MINTLGGRFGGHGLYLLKGKPVLCTTSLACNASGGKAGSAHARQAHRYV